MRLFGYGWVDKNLSPMEIRELATFYARSPSENNYTLPPPLINPAQEADIELMVVPSQRVAKMTRKEHVASFFDEGILQLGTYEFFRNAGNSEVRDHQEGLVTLIGQGFNRTAWGRFQGGEDNYIFCTYLGEPDPEVLKAFEYEDRYYIDDPVGFAGAIKTALNAQEFSFGKCVYCEEKALVGGLNPDHSFERIDQRTIEMIGEAMHFVKPVRFSHQMEFRFAWKMPIDVRGTLLIRCPDAVQFCSRV